MATPNRAGVTTPSRRAISADPPSTTATTATTTRLSVRTPSQSASARRGAGAGGGSQQRSQRLSASARKYNGYAAAANAAATPVARAASRALDTTRRAAHLTPHYQRDRRRSLREQRETPRDALRALGRVLAPQSNLVTGSSSSPGGAGSSSSLPRLRRVAEDDDDDDIPIDRPRLSLPIDEDDDLDAGGDLRPHRSAGLEDLENVTVQSIEMPRRAVSEQPLGARFSMAGGRMSDYYYDQSEEGGVDSGYFPPRHPIDDDGLGDDDQAGEGDISYERLDSEAGRRETGRESDFGIDVPILEIEEETFVMAADAREVTDRLDVTLAQMEVEFPATDDPIEDDEEELDDVQGGFDDEHPEESAGEDVEVELQTTTAKSAQQRARRKKRVKVSRHGIEYPSLPPAVVKRLAQTFAKTSGAKGKISQDTLTAVMQASDWFFDQVGDDLAAYAKHAGRKTIDESDVLTLMRRQRQVNSSTTPFALAQKYLPRELLQELRMPPPVLAKKRRRAAAEDEDEELG